MSEKKRVMSGIQPTGKMHFGNYFGAVANWVHLQKDYECFFSVVDYHAITMPYDPVKLRQNTWELCFNLLACGVNIERLFIQSLVPEHAELSWLLSSTTSYGQLSRMTQFKDKSKQAGEQSRDGFISAGLFSYPVLQAADILIYQADLVPVGHDQQQHLELTRNIAERFNQQFNKDFFNLPEPLYTETPKIMSTADPTRKMSKSAGDKHYIDIFAEENRIRKQIRSAVTDTGEGNSNEMSPGVANLFELLKAAGANQEREEMLTQYNAGSLSYKDLKEVVADTLVQINTDLREKKEALKGDKKEIKRQIKQHSFEIRKVARETLRAAKEIAGLMNVRL
jgi:tryptophanyl-tRNA synthetase